MKKNIYRLLLISCLFSLCVDTFSQGWIPVCSSTRGEAVTMEVLQDDASCYIVKVRINGIYDSTIVNEHGAFHSLSLGIGGKLTTTGDPSLPCVNQLIAIPSKKNMNVTIHENKWADIEVGTVYPAQLSEVEQNTPNVFTMNVNSYREPFSPNLLTVGNEMYWRNILCRGLAICPFKYYPTESRLSVLSEFIVNVKFFSLDQEHEVVLQKDYDVYHLFSNTVFVDAGLSSSLRSGNNGDNYDYLIILGSAIDTLNTTFKDKLKEFRRWKALKGYKTKVFSTGTTGIYDFQIKEFIKQEYDSAKVRYVLFIGNNNMGGINMKAVVSPYNGRMIKSDYWYGCLDGDNDRLAEIPIGRLPTTSVEGFCNFVDKVIKYESVYNSSNRVLLMANKEGAGTFGSYQSCCDSIRGIPYNDTVSFITAYGASIFYQGNNATNADVINHINQGAHIINYRGHAGNDYWGGSDWSDSIWNESGEIFKSAELLNMSNETCAVFFSVACLTGNIDADSCMLRNYLVSSKGAAAFIGATEKSFTVPNNTYNPYLFKKLLNNGIYHIGDLNVAAHSSNITFDTSDSLCTDNAYTYLCGADPTMEIWTSVPKHIEVKNYSSTNTTVTISTNLSGGYKLCLVSEIGELLDSISVSGSSCSFTKPPSNFYFSINKHNYFPYIAHYNSDSNTIQDKSFSNIAYFYDNTPLDIGESVTEEGDYGPVVVQEKGKLFIVNHGGVTIHDSFECKKGGTLYIK